MSNITIADLSASEISVDVFRGPMNSGGFRSGRWTVTVRGQQYRIFATVSAYNELDAQERLVRESAFRDLTSGSGSAVLIA